MTARTRRLRLLTPVIGLGGALLTYALHHTPPLDDHGLTALVLIAATALLTTVSGETVLGRLAVLPEVVALRPGLGEVRTATAADLGFCAALHAEVLGHGLFSALGPRFLRAYLATFVASPHAVALVYASRGRPLGSVMGVLSPGAHARWVLRKRGPRLASLGAVALLTRPLTTWRFCRTRITRYVRVWRMRRGADPAPNVRVEPAVLSHVAVLPGAQGHGIGAELVSAFVARARDTGRELVALTTLDGAAGAAAFYRRLGWTEATRRTNVDGQETVGFRLVLMERPT